MAKYAECCGYTVPQEIYDFFAENEFSVRAVCVLCRLHCDTVGELLFNLREIAEGRLFLRNCGKRTTAEIAEKIAKYPQEKG